VSSEAHLANPVLEVPKPDGSAVTNDDWKMTQGADIAATGLAPTDELESAILFTLPVGEGAYTAIVRGAQQHDWSWTRRNVFGRPVLGNVVSVIDSQHSITIAFARKDVAANAQAVSPPPGWRLPQQQQKVRDQLNTQGAAPRVVAND